MRTNFSLAAVKTLLNPRYKMATSRRRSGIQIWLENAHFGWRHESMRAHAYSLTFKLTHFFLLKCSYVDLDSFFTTMWVSRSILQMRQLMIDTLVKYKWVNRDSLVVTNESIYTWLTKIMLKCVKWLTFYCGCKSTSGPPYPNLFTFDVLRHGAKQKMDRCRICPSWP